MKSLAQKAELLLSPTNTPEKQLQMIISSGIDNIQENHQNSSSLIWHQENYYQLQSLDCLLQWHRIKH